MRSPKSRKRKRAPELYDAFRFYTDLRNCLFQDLGKKDYLGLKNTLKSLKPLDRTKRTVPGVSQSAPSYIFKAAVQLENLDKRIIWPKDRPNKELEKESLEGFLESQKDFGFPVHLNAKLGLLVPAVREVVGEILGEFQVDRWLNLCAFGRKAALGLEKRNAYLDIRFQCLNGTKKQILWFKEALSRNVQLNRAVRQHCRYRFTEVNAVAMTAVPKSYKAARIVAPDTTIGGFLSRGLGTYLREQLEANTHIDLALQPDRHKKWACEASLHGHLATLDMSKASDSFVWGHIIKFLPSSWLCAMDAVRTPKVSVLGELYSPSTFMLMGSGHTFPLQTILFYAICEAIRRLTKTRGKVSAYGDDLIVPTRIATICIECLQELGFSINTEKSFYQPADQDCPSAVLFRESCGGDFRNGIDVRPWMPECNLQEEKERYVSKYEMLALCYRSMNGLAERWDPDELPETFTYLLASCRVFYGKAHVVPSYEGDECGLHEEVYRYWFLQIVDCQFPTRDRCGNTSYYRLMRVSRKRARSHQERPYLWYSLFLKEHPCAPDRYSSDSATLPENRRDSKPTLKFRNSKE
jgi:hypothetical protein